MYEKSLLTHFARKETDDISLLKSYSCRTTNEKKRTGLGLVLKKCFIAIPSMGFATNRAFCFDFFKSAEIGVLGKFQPGEYGKFGFWTFDKQFV